MEELAQHVQEPAKLKEAVKALYRKHASDTPPDGDPGGDLQREYTRHGSRTSPAPASSQIKRGQANPDAVPVEQGCQHVNLTW